MGPLMNMVNNLGLAVVAGIGRLAGVQGLATVGTIAAFVNYAGRFGRPLNQIASLFNSIQSALAGAERVFELMDETPEIDAPDAQPLEHVDGDVVLRRRQLRLRAGRAGAEERQPARRSRAR